MGRRAGPAAALIVVLLAAGCGSPPDGLSGGPVDLLVFAPHPDDETLGCAGILHQALKRGERVKVVIFTNGDGFPASASLIARKPVERLGEDDFHELARFRQVQSRTAHAALGGRPEDLVFLGYPDSALDEVYRTSSPIPFRQRYTGRSETYGMAQQDYHRDVHGRPAPYTYEAVLGDVTDLIRRLRPARICVTHEADAHPDHRAAFRFVRDAVQKTAYRGELDAYLVHGGSQWPWPLGKTPGSPYDLHDVKGEWIPKGVPWPPSRRVALTPEEIRVKESAIEAQASHLTAEAEGPMKEERAYLESFVKSEEVFWRLERR